jgi:hypothetical protein
MKKYTEFLSEDANSDFARQYNSNLSTSFDSILSLVDMSPEKFTPGTEEYVTQKQQGEKKKFETKKSLYKRMSQASDLVTALNMASAEASKFYSAIGKKLDATQQTRAELKAAQKGREVSLPGLPYEPSPMPKEVLERAPIAKYFVESIAVLKDIANQLSRPGFESLKEELFSQFKEYFSKAANQELKESFLLEKKDDIRNYLVLFDDLRKAVDVYRTQILGMISTIKTTSKTASSDTPVTKLSNFEGQLWDKYDWLSNNENFFIGSLDEDAQKKKIMGIKTKMDEISKFLDDATFKNGFYSSLKGEMTKPSSQGLGQFSNMLSDSTRLMNTGLDKLTDLQRIITNMWKSVQIFKGFGSGDITNALEDVVKGISGTKEEDLKKALQKKVSKMTPGQQAPKFEKIGTIEGLKVEDLSRALSPLTNFQKDLEKKQKDERAFTLSTRVLNNPQGLPNLKEFEGRFQKKSN